MIEDLKVFHKIYEFLKWIHALLNRFPKSEKYTMAQKIEKYELGVIIFNKLMESFNSWEAYMNHADTFLLKKSLKERYLKNIM